MGPKVPLGETDTGAGESRRNENVQFRPIDNNALRELNIRTGASAAVVEEFRADRGYFGGEFGNAPPAALHVTPPRVSRLHGSLFESHNNSVFSARSFFQVGAVKPATGPTCWTRPSWAAASPTRIRRPGCCRGAPSRLCAPPMRAATSAATPSARMGSAT